ncbi:MAG: hypothetical protein VKJ46_09100, partial [Leptolyngbyaceae bacterium]|nr:hypothetical protein [Leptolyngbyaceae bacterium]
NSSAHFKQMLHDKMIEHKQYIRQYGEDMPEIRNWKWPYGTPTELPTDGAKTQIHTTPSQAGAEGVARSRT